MSGARHVARFYGDEALHLASVADHLAGALDAGGTAVLAATASHRAAVRRHLQDRGHDPAALARAGSLCELDAPSVLTRIVRGNDIDRDRLAAEVLAAMPPDRSGPVHVYGELVAILWTSGRFDATVALEEAWNDLAAGRPYRLLCGYPGRSICGENVNALGSLCTPHDHVVRDDALHWTSARPLELLLSLDAAPDAARVARRAAAGVLSAFADEPARSSAAVVVSELVTNAVLHGEEPVIFSMRYDDQGCFHIAVSDGGQRPVDRRRSRSGAATGRGLELVAGLSHRWGTVQTPAGKTVWADITNRSRS